MSDPAPTRQETVEANIAQLLATYGEGAEKKMITQCVKDISISLAMLVDNGTTSSAES